jgi:hypothetical protein
VDPWFETQPPQTRWRPIGLRCTCIGGARAGHRGIRTRAVCASVSRLHRLPRCVWHRLCALEYIHLSILCGEIVCAPRYKRTRWFNAGWRRTSTRSDHSRGWGGLRQAVLPRAHVPSSRGFFGRGHATCVQDAVDVPTVEALAVWFCQLDRCPTLAPRTCASLWARLDPGLSVPSAPPATHDPGARPVGLRQTRGRQTDDPPFV